MATLTPIAETSELAAVNRLLSAIGEAPISDLTTSTREDVALAVSLLKEASVEVQSMGWRFNTEYGYELAPADTLSWTDTDGDTTTLNVWTKPTGLLSYKLTQSPAQAELDVILRKSRFYQEGSPAANVLVFYDRKLNRDGLDSDHFEHLYIDPVWMVDWAYLPEVARRYIVCRAARQFIQQTLGADNVVGYGEGDELRAFNALQQQEGEEEDISLLDNTSVSNVRGLRPNWGGFYDDRSSPNHS
jgi:hypothetical protein